MNSQIHFLTTAEGVRLAFCTSGEGPPLVVVPSWISHLELDQHELVGPHFFEQLGHERLLVRYDKRGMGLSHRDLSDYSLQAQVADLHALVEHLGLRDITLFGSSQGGAIAVAYTAQHPRIVSRLILYGTYHSIPHAVRKKMAAVLPLVKEDWTGLGTAPLLEMFVPGAPPEMRELFASYQREAANGRDAAAIMGALVGYEVTPLLPSIRAPTLVLHRRDDTAVASSQGRDLAAMIPDATFVALEGRVHLPYWGETQPLLEAIEEFLGGRTLPRERPSVFRVILFTDIVGHTEMMSRVGDDAGRQVLREHERITREVLAAHEGSEIKTLGDGFMASFPSVASAIDCSIDLQRAIEDRNLRVQAEPNNEPAHIRIGLNAGEPIEEDGDLFGATVILAARIASLAEGGEILVSDTVRGLGTGKGFLFQTRGEFRPKGFEESVRIYSVRWRRSAPCDTIPALSTTET